MESIPFILESEVDGPAKGEKLTLFGFWDGE